MWVEGLPPYLTIPIENLAPHVHPDDKMYVFEVVSQVDIDSLNKIGELGNAMQMIPVLNKTPGTYRLLTPHQDYQFASQRPFFFQDEKNTYFVTPRKEILYIDIQSSQQHDTAAGMDKDAFKGLVSSNLVSPEKVNSINFSRKNKPQPEFIGSDGMIDFAGLGIHT